MAASEGDGSAAGYTVPPDIYDIAVGWDPQPEADRLLLLARQAGLRPDSALELGCGTGRLLSVLRAAVPDVWGIELSPAMAELARSRSAATIVVGDMSAFSLRRRFDLIFTSANTVRHILSDAACARLWACIGEHLHPGGVFIADLELGVAAAGQSVGKPITWTVARGGDEVRATWQVVRPPSAGQRCCTVEYTFELRGLARRGFWKERFCLRVYEAAEFVAAATRSGDLRLSGIYELRDPYLPATTVARAAGRHLVVFQRLAGT